MLMPYVCRSPIFFILLSLLPCGMSFASNVDTRLVVPLPKTAYLHELALMRDHLRAMAAIERKMGQRQWLEAARIAQMHLGLSVMGSRQMRRMHRDMPAGMQQIGMAFHRQSELFVVQLQNTAATGQVGRAFQALADVTSNCVACHAAYRFEIKSSP